MLNKHGMQFTGIVLALMSTSAFADPECGPLDQANLGFVQPGEEGLPVAETTPVEVTGICEEPEPTNNVVNFVPQPVSPVAPAPAPAPQPVVTEAPAPQPQPVVEVPVPQPTPSHVTIMSTRIEVEGSENVSSRVVYEEAEETVEQVVEVSSDEGSNVESTRVEYDSASQSEYQYEPAQDTVVAQEASIVEETVEVEVEVLEQQPLVTTVHRPAPAPKTSYSNNITIRNYGCAKNYLTAEYIRQPGSHGGCGNRELYAPKVTVEEHAGYGAQPVVETVVEETIVEETIVEEPVSVGGRCTEHWMGLCRRMTAPGNHGSGL